MTNHFQRAVSHAVPLEKRRAAIDALVANSRASDLAVLVRTRGLSGGLRREAIDGLATCNADEELAAVAADTSLPPEIRRTAEQK
ncbi:hypothetical protein [Halorubrum sp. DTA46]|uniref:hypothetical protein n=1 Tax=Halorubrum sp. DTA46 TaxID=3402162 RepID=UPI003AADFF46